MPDTPLSPFFVTPVENDVYTNSFKRYLGRVCKWQVAVKPLFGAVVIPFWGWLQAFGLMLL